MMYDEPEDGPVRGCALTLGRRLAAVILITALAWACYHVIPALAVRDNPPLGCQLLGGTWSIWSGWTCGS